jgi:acetyl esterase/lipase/cation diffusion facilitator CzcD-associated flavoprotein CzcO
VGAERFAGEVYYTSTWPHEGVDFTGKRVGVIGTGSSGVQSIPLIAEQAEQLTVFQRTPNFSVPAHNGPVDADRLAPLLADRTAYRTEARVSPGGVPRERNMIGAWQLTEEQQRERFEAAVAEGELFAILNTFADQAINHDSNKIMRDLLRERIRNIVDDPDTAEMLCPKDYPFGTKRPCLDTDYYATFNRPNVRLVDLQSQPLTTVTETGIEVEGETFEFDALVYATGFDAMTGALVAVDITGRDGVTLSKKWEDGPVTYLGLTTAGFPNLFMITGPGSPSVLSNMAVSIEQHVEWIGDRLAFMRDNGFDTIEPTEEAEFGWVRHVADGAGISLFPEADSWYMGSNVPGKPVVFMAYVGGVDFYRDTCDRVVDGGMVGFHLQGPAGSQTNDGIINRLMPDVSAMLRLMEEAGMPQLETLPVEMARQVMEMTAAIRPPGPDVGEIVDGTLKGADGELNYRLYRPSTDGPHPIVAYFHGGGWTIGSEVSDDPLCRDLCVKSDSIVISVGYRHAPEARFPAAAEDGIASVRWIAENAEDLGGVPSKLAVAGWSAGANVATVAARIARDEGGPAIAGQLLLNPVTDCDMETGSYGECAEGFQLSKPLMEWFWGHYADEADRNDPRASPLQTPDLSGMPPTVILTSEFDPLRDEGMAYAAALEAAGVPVTASVERGQIHTSLTMVDQMISSRDARERMGAALRGFFASVPA